MRAEGAREKGYCKRSVFQRCKKVCCNVLYLLCGETVLSVDAHYSCNVYCTNGHV